MYEIVFAKIAKKQLNKLDSRYKSAITKAIKRLAENPKIGSPLRGELKGKRRLRFSRYRTIYQVQNSQLIVMIMSIRHRKDAYK